MSPSIYSGCQIEDDITESLQVVKGTFKQYKDDTDATLAALQTDLSQLTGTAKYAEVTIGSAPSDQIRWVAKQPGPDGNNIRIMYQNLGPVPNPVPPPAYLDRATSTAVVGTTIYVSLQIRGGNPIGDPLVGTVDNTVWTVAACLPIWLSNPDVSNLVSATLVDGVGAGYPKTTSMISLSGGVGAPLKDAETLADSIAKQFGQNSYQGLMKSLSIPVVESAEDAASYLESVDQRYCIINKKLLLVEGTNLIGLRNLYNAVQKNLVEFKRVLALMVDNDLVPHVVYTETVEQIIHELVCNRDTTFSTFSDYYIGFDMSLVLAEQNSRSKQQSSLNSFIFWIKEANPCVQAYKKLSVWGFPDDYITAILAGESPEQSGYTALKPPVVSIIETPDLFTLLNFTDSEMVELLEKDVDGVKLPSSSDQQDKQEAVNNLIRNDKKFLDTGLKSRIKKPIAVLQAVDVSSTMNDTNLSKELATRGKACARTEKNFKIGTYEMPELPSLDLPNLPTNALPDPAKKVESAFAALSSMISSASKLFDTQVDGILKTCKSVLNKVQNIASLADNLFNNDMVKCLLGTSSVTTGMPDLPSPSNPGGIPSNPIGGLPLPMGMFKLVLKELSFSLDKTITSAFEKLMSLIQYPLCMVQSLLSSIMGMDLGGLLNPCKSGNDPDSKCNKNEIQDIINSSNDMSKVFESLPQMDQFDTSRVTTEVNETIQKFTGQAIKSVTQTVQDIQRGINDVIDDLMKSLDAKMKTVTELFNAVKKLISETSELADDAETSETKEKGCSPPSLGFFTDSITKYI